MNTELGKWDNSTAHGNDDPLLSGAKDTFAVRGLNKAFQTQKLLHRNEEAFHDFMLVLCAESRNRRMEATYTDEEFSDVQRQEAANTTLTWEDAQQLVAAILLSRLGTAENVAKVLGQSWVPTWDGWKELQTCMTEAHCVAIADRMCDIAQVNSPARSMTDTQALQALAAEGFVRQQAQSHGANNCLIDSLMLCLSNECILPENLRADVRARRHIAAACREQLIHEVGKAVAPSRKGLFPYLDAHRDGPRIVMFLLQRFCAVARTNMLIHVHDRFGECTADPHRNKILVHLGFEHPVQQVLQLHIYNHTSVQGRGYHFDTLLRRMIAREPESATKRHAKASATISQSEKLKQKQDNKAGDMSQRPHDNMTGTEEEKEHRAKTVFTKMAWRVCDCSFVTPWIEALVLNLCFHGYVSLGSAVDASQDVRYQICRACQAHLLLEQKQSEEEERLALQRHLASAMSFLVGSSNGGVNAEVYIHDANATDLNTPRDRYSVGQSDSLLAPILRFYKYKNGQYAALLPDIPTALPQALRPLPGDSSCHTEAQAASRIEPVNAASGSNLEQMRDILQRFCDSRGAKVQISAADACRLQDAWSDRDAEGICLHTLLQAGLRFADSGMHHARRLADQFRSFWTCCTQGAGQTLEGAAASAATSRDRTELPPTVPDQREGAANDNDKKLLGKPIDEAGAANKDSCRAKALRPKKSRRGCSEKNCTEGRKETKASKHTAGKAPVPFQCGQEGRRGSASAPGAPKNITRLLEGRRNVRGHGSRRHVNETNRGR